MIGSTGRALDWFRLYLSYRCQFPHIHDVSSSYNRVSPEVPQGSVLVPIVFTLSFVKDSY